MLKIYYNEKSNANIDITLIIKGNYCKVECSDLCNLIDGMDVIENIQSYTSYALVENEGKTKNYREMHKTNFKWLELNRLGVSIKMDFAKIVQLYGTRDIIQLDTGMFCDKQKDIIIRVFEGSKDKIVLDVDQEYELLPFNSDDLITGSHPRMTLWDSYSLTANRKEFKANRKGLVIDGEPDIPIIPDENGCIEFIVTKYRGDFSSGEKLCRSIDNEEVFVDTSVGCVDNKRVRLANGVGRFKLMTFGYVGSFKLKLGRKWYEVWNDYNLIIGDR